jgi:DNA repair exonuclease SbcCD ATPase subunit
MSTMPRPDFLVVDEVLDGVSAENYSKIETLFNKILSDYKFIIHVTHIEEVKDWHSQIITVNKTGNISTISTINN